MTTPTPLSPEELARCRSAFERELPKLFWGENIQLSERDREVHALEIEKLYSNWQSAWAAAQAQGVDTDNIRESVHEQLAEESGYWHTCSGCYEGGEYGGNSHNYPYSETFKCQLGSGCHECGGIGALWDNTDYSDFLKPTPPEQHSSGEVG